ncbi:glycosyltransferase [Tenacibaculum xiamenense]|uniref:glycosyltransferase n=1 Tax=Tenacibaculum xiamenense TaxID=1261553 RepID=UPI0038B54462
MLKKILIVQHQNFINGSGGTEKICCFLANELLSLGYEVEIATNENSIGQPVFHLDSKIKITNIYSDDINQKEIKPYVNYHGKNPFKWIKFKVKKKLAKLSNKKLMLSMGGFDNVYKFNLHQRSKLWNQFILSSKPDLIITMTIGSLLEITYEKEFNIPIVNSVNGRPDYDYTDQLWYRSKIDMKFLKESYKHLSGIQILFNSYKDFLPGTFNGVCKVIPNPVPQLNEVINHSQSKDRYRIINMASLVLDCKQQDLALKVFAEIAEEYPNWDLFFWGEGNGLNKLEELIEDYKLQNRVFLKGFTETPLEELKSSDIFIFPSKYEGFPLALTEAMSVGLPSLGFESCSGVNELIKHNKTGFLAKNTEEMKNYLEKLMIDSKLRQDFGINAQKDMSVYTSEYVKGEWNQMIKEVLG